VSEVCEEILDGLGGFFVSVENEYIFVGLHIAEIPQ